MNLVSIITMIAVIALYVTYIIDIAYNNRIRQQELDLVLDMLEDIVEKMEGTK